MGKLVWEDLFETLPKRAQRETAEENGWKQSYYYRIHDASFANVRSSGGVWLIGGGGSLQKANVELFYYIMKRAANKASLRTILKVKPANLKMPMKRTSP